MRRLILFSIILVLIGLLAPAPAHSVVVQYQTLASFDFLDAAEVSNFVNTTLTGEVWNSWNTTEYGTVSYTVSGGQLNITSTAGTLGSKEGLLLYPTAFEGYADIVLSSGVIAVLHPANSSDIQTGFEIVKDATGITIYSVNGTSKTVVSSLSTNANEVLVSVLNGNFEVKLPDGTSLYTDVFGNDLAILGLGTLGGSSAVFDKVVLYGVMLAGTAEVDLGTITLTSSANVGSFKYDVSQYSEIKAAKLVITFSSSDDGYKRFYIVSTSQPTSTFWKDASKDNALKFGVIARKANIRVDITTLVQNNPTGTIYVGVSVFSTYSWTASAKIVLDVPVQDQDNNQNDDTTVEQDGQDQSWWNSLGNTTKYLLIGAGAIFLLIIVITFMNGSTRRGRAGGVTPLVAIILIFLVLGGIAAAVLAWLHPQYLTALAFGLGAIALIAIFLFIMSGRSIPNPLKQ